MQGSGRDFERSPWCYLLWGVPGVVAAGASAANQASLLTTARVESLWVFAVAWAGVGCLINAQSCGRIHCWIDGIAFPILAVAGVLNLLSAVSFSWSVFWVVFLVVLAGSFVPEFLWWKYL